MASHNGEASSTSGTPGSLPATATSRGFYTDADSSQSRMSHTCQACAKRKIKCDKALPICASCQKGKLECVYLAPLPRQRKRKANDEMTDKVALYEEILRQHGLLPQAALVSPPVAGPTTEPMAHPWIEPEISGNGKLLASKGKSRYVNSSLWRNLDENDVGGMYSDEEGEEEQGTVTKALSSDPLTEALVGTQQTLSQHHPTHTDAKKLWKIYVENVEPLCKILHIPSLTILVDQASQRQTQISKAEECLLFAVYHFAVFSMTEDECLSSFGQLRTQLMHKYRAATKQALVNARFLKTTDMTILQALVLLLLPGRHFYDPHTYWILTGVAVRIAQRMGLHRDGEKLGLPPFDVEMRRRLFYQVIPLDGIAGQMSGTGIAVMPDTWDTERPLNIEDDQLWFGMTERPQEQSGPTGMIFCLTRSCIGLYFTKSWKAPPATNFMLPGDNKTFESVISQAESEVEDKYIRYCDVTNPLHYLASCFARSAINAVRLRIRLPKVKDRTASGAELKEVIQLAQKTMDINAAVHSQANLKKYRWFMKPFFAWGSWDSLIFMAIILRRGDLLSHAETSAAWERLENIYNLHSELLELKKALYAAIGRLVLAAWRSSKSGDMPEPGFIAALRVWQERGLPRGAKYNDAETTLQSAALRTETHKDPSLLGNTGETSDRLFEDVGSNEYGDQDLGTIDWDFWEQLIHNHHVQDTERSPSLEFSF